MSCESCQTLNIYNYYDAGKDNTERISIFKLRFWCVPVIKLTRSVFKCSVHCTWYFNTVKSYLQYCIIWQNKINLGLYWAGNMTNCDLQCILWPAKISCSGRRKDVIGQKKEMWLAVGCIGGFRGGLGCGDCNIPSMWSHHQQCQLLYFHLLYSPIYQLSIYQNTCIWIVAYNMMQKQTVRLVTIVSIMATDAIHPRYFSRLHRMCDLHRSLRGEASSAFVNLKPLQMIGSFHSSDCFVNRKCLSHDRIILQERRKWSVTGTLDFDEILRTFKGAAVAEWLSSCLAEQEDQGSIPGLATRIFRDWLSPPSKSRYGWNTAEAT